jgi:cobalamin biosynthesis protein CbiG
MTTLNQQAEQIAGERELEAVVLISDKAIGVGHRKGMKAEEIYFQLRMFLVKWEMASAGVKVEGFEVKKK